MERESGAQGSSFSPLGETGERSFLDFPRNLSKTLTVGQDELDFGSLVPKGVLCKDFQSLLYSSNLSKTLNVDLDETATTHR
jgi:hypothetical protein